MVLVDAAIAWSDKKKAQWAREAAERAQLARTMARAEAAAEASAAISAEPIARAIEQVRDDACDEAHREWRAWYARFADAAARSLPFDEAQPDDQRAPTANTVARAEAVAKAVAATSATPIVRTIEEAAAQGRAEANRRWCRWYGRYADAKARGVPCGEAPPA